MTPVRWIRSGRWGFSDAITRRHEIHAAQSFGDQTACESSHGDAFGFGRMIERRDEAVLKPGRVVFELRHWGAPDHQRRRTHHCPIKDFTIRPGDERLWHKATMGKAQSSQELMLLPIRLWPKSHGNATHAPNRDQRSHGSGLDYDVRCRFGGVVRLIAGRLVLSVWASEDWWLRSRWRRLRFFFAGLQTIKSVCS